MCFLKETDRNYRFNSLLRYNRFSSLRRRDVTIHFCNGVFLLLILLWRTTSVYCVCFEPIFESQYQQNFYSQFLFALKESIWVDEEERC
jgi:hypothetical protein